MFWTIFYCALDILKVVLKALAVMGLAGLGGAALTRGLKDEKDPLSVGFGVFVLVGALILFMAWYWPR